MLLKTYKTTFLQELSSLYDEKEIESFFFIVLEHYHHMKRINLALNPDIAIDATQLDYWNSIVVELKKQKPIQYIIGTTEFFGLSFLVDQNTLIPRPETEELVEWILESTKYKIQSTKLKILDIGTGSGCIAISLAKNLPLAQVTAIDVSEKALEKAQKNALFNAVEVNFMFKDILETSDLNEQYDVIVSNPPYIRNLEKNEIKSNVLDYEPHLALFVTDNDPLLFYRKIAQLAMKNLSKNGQLFFEINQYLGNETVDLLQKMGFQNIVLKKDVYGNDRMISCAIAPF